MIFYPFLVSMRVVVGVFAVFICFMTRISWLYFSLFSNHLMRPFFLSLPLTPPLRTIDRIVGHVWAPGARSRPDALLDPL